MPNKDYSDEIRKAVRHYWRTKKAAHKKNQTGKKADAAKRAALRGARARRRP